MCYIIQFKVRFSIIYLNTPWFCFANDLSIPVHFNVLFITKWIYIWYGAYPLITHSAYLLLQYRLPCCIYKLQYRYNLNKINYDFNYYRITSTCSILTLSSPLKLQYAQVSCQLCYIYNDMIFRSNLIPRQI